MTIPRAALNCQAAVRPRIDADTLGIQTVVGCRAELDRAFVTRDADGTETQVTSGRAFFPPHVLLPPGSEITIDGRTYRTTSEKRPWSVRGPMYTEVRFS